MTKIKIVSYNPHRDGDRYLDGVVKCYQESFAGPPWNESHTCPECKNFFGSDTMHALHPSTSCPVGTCGGALQEFWPKEEVDSDFLSETKTDASISRFPSSWIALANDTVIGICWGYTISPKELESKLQLPGFEQDAGKVFDLSESMIAYQDELAVLPEYQMQRFDSLVNRSVARALVEARQVEFDTMGANLLVVRTLAKPATATYNWYTNVGFKVVSKYPDNPNRVILARSRAGLRY